MFNTNKFLYYLRLIIFTGLTFLSLWNLGYSGNSDVWIVLAILSSFRLFDESQGGGYNRRMTHFGHMKEVYEKAGYKLPKIVFWNLDAHFGTPAKCSDDSVAMVSGFSPSIMKAVLNAEEFNPVSVMMEALKDIEIDYSNLPSEFEYEREVI